MNPPDPQPIRAIPVRHPGRWITAALILFGAAAALYSVATNERFHWDVFGEYFFSAPILRGLVITIELTIIAMVVGIALGVVFAVMRLSANPLVAGASSFYIWLFRGTPVLVQLLFWSFVGAVYPRVGLSVPFGGEEVFGASANVVFTPYVAAILGLGLNEAAYMAEIVRAGIGSVDEGQTEAAQALGLRRMQTMRRIVLPQAMRVIVPPTGNETISMLKTTALVSVIPIADLLYSSQLIYSRTYQQIPLLLVASAWYLILTTLLTVGQYYIERHYARGSSRSGPGDRSDYVRRNLFRFRTQRSPGSGGVGGLS
ncbi:MAG: amino acid ABC transporter permease [Thermoleophilaceae bacterium]|nr:amino acid ABC transporter permease [Thermoleophilaceae bacterium]